LFSFFTLFFYYSPYENLRFVCEVEMEIGTLDYNRHGGGMSNAEANKTLTEYAT